MYFLAAHKFEISKSLFGSNVYHNLVQPTYKNLLDLAWPNGFLMDGRMVFASICEHASSAFIFASTTAVINFLMRAASTLEIANGEQRALRKFSANWNLSLLKLSVVLRHVIWLTLSKQHNRRW